MVSEYLWSQYGGAGISGKVIVDGKVRINTQDIRTFPIHEFFVKPHTKV